MKEIRYAIRTRDGRYVNYNHPCISLVDSIRRAWPLRIDEASQVSKRLMTMGVTHTIEVVTINKP